MLLPPIPCRSETIVVMAPGPSLSQFQIDLIKASGLFTVAIGEAGRVGHPGADITYHCERFWWNYYKGCPHITGFKAAMQDTDYPDVYECPRSAMSEGFDFEYPKLVTGYNSGYQAINLAIHFKPKRLILVGYDMKDAADGRHNIAGDHPAEIKRPTNFVLFREHMKTLLKPLEDLGITVYNCTIDTELTCFPKKELTDVLGA